MRILVPAVLAVFLMMAPCVALSQEEMPQSPIPQTVPKLTYPKIVLFSTSWCPHCKAAKEYFTRNNIPFINRDVELDSDALALLTGTYKSQGVPVIVIGEDAAVLRGFDESRFEKAVEKFKNK
jgi:glutaredoxin-like YruB-family protein